MLLGAEGRTGRMLSPGVANALRDFSTQPYPEGICLEEASPGQEDLNPSLPIYWLLGLAKTCNSSMPQFLYLVMRLV